MDLIESASAMIDRAPRIALAGGAVTARAIAREIVGLDAGRVVLIGGSPGEGEELAAAAGGGAVAGKDLGATKGCSLVVLAGEGPGAGTADGTAACVARYAPEAVVLIAAERSLPRARDFLNASRLPSRQVLAIGGLARVQARAANLASRFGLNDSQVSLLVAGGEDEKELLELRRYTVAAGIPLALLTDALKAGCVNGDRSIRPPSPGGEVSLASAAALIADAVLRDRRRVLCCGVFAEAARGLPALFATLPAIIGRHGCEEIFPAPLTLEERSFLQRAAAPAHDGDARR